MIEAFQFNDQPKLLMTTTEIENSINRMNDLLLLLLDIQHFKCLFLTKPIY